MPIPLGSRMDTFIGQSSSPLSEERDDRKTSFASQDRTDSRYPKVIARRQPSADECHDASRLPSCEERTNGGAPGCRLPQAVAATHVRTRTISHARTPGTIPSSRCQTTRTRSMLRPARISVLMDEMLQPTGGASRDRTDDLMLAKHALSQLSYGPLT
jgi:hypothetical protein